MGIFDQIEAEVKALENRRTTKPQRLGVSVTTDSTIKKTDDILAKFPILLREKVLKKAVRAAARPIVTEARRRAPRGKQEDRDKWSKTLKAKHSQRTIDLRKSIAVKVVAYESRIVAFVGPRRPYGNHANLIEYGHYLHLWGAPSPDRYQLPRPFLRPAADSTQDEQARRFVEKVMKEWAKL